MSRYDAIKKIIPIILVSLLFQAVVPSQAQTASATQALQDDPRTILIAVAQRNNLERDRVQPWHLRATYEIFDVKGNSEGTGTFEEWWVSTRKNKNIIATKGYSRTDYHIDEGVFRVEAGKFSTFIGPAIKAPVRPLSEENLDDFTPEMQERTIANIRLKCITLTWRRGAPVVPITHMYCFDPDHLNLRLAVSEYSLYDTFYDNVVHWQDQYLAKDVRVVRSRTPVANVHIEKFESLSDIKEAEFAAPNDAKKVPPGPSGMGSPMGLTEDHFVRHVQPKLPEIAKATHDREEVVVKFTINKDGHVTDPQIISGYSFFQQTLLDALTQWEYKPFLDNHEPIEVQSTARFKTSP